MMKFGVQADLLDQLTFMEAMGMILSTPPTEALLLSLSKVAEARTQSGLILTKVLKAMQSTEHLSVFLEIGATDLKMTHSLKTQVYKIKIADEKKNSKEMMTSSILEKEIHKVLELLYMCMLETVMTKSSRDPIGSKHLHGLEVATTR